MNSLWLPLLLVVIIIDSTYAVLLPPTSGGIDYGICRVLPPSQAELSLLTPRLQRQPIEYCPTARVNNISPACREYWMRKAIKHQLDGSIGTAHHLCPTSFHASILVDHSDSSPTNHFDNEGKNCGKMLGSSNGQMAAGRSSADTPESDAIRSVAEQMISVSRTRQFWNKFTQYSTIEPSAAAAAQQVQAGIKEVVYGVRTGELIELNYPLIRQSAIQLAKQQANMEPIAPLVYIGQVLREEILPYVAWQHNSSNPCPTPCVPYYSGIKCRMP